MLLLLLLLVRLKFHHRHHTHNGFSVPFEIKIVVLFDGKPTPVDMKQNAQVDERRQVASSVAVNRIEMAF